MPLEEDALGRLLSLCPRRVLRVGDVGDAPDFAEAALLFVETGMVVLTSGARAKRRIVFSFCPHGTLLPPPRRNEQLTALADSALISVTPDLQRKLLQLPAVAEEIIDALLDALRERQDSLAQFANVQHAERLREKFLQLARLHGTVATDGIRVELPLTHELLGQAVGYARETVTSALKMLEGDGFLVRDGRRYRLAISPAILIPEES